MQKERGPHMQRKKALIAMAGAAGMAFPSALAVASNAPGVLLGKPLKPPAAGPVRVGFVLGANLVAIDWIGPWQAFGDAFLGKDMDMSGPPLFDFYTITADGGPVLMDGVRIGAQHSVLNAPQPHVLVVPGQQSTPASIAYIKAAAAHADVTMSVCTGAFLVARAGLLNGLKATTHHSAYDQFEKTFPGVTLIRGAKYVENASVCSSGGESSGIDLALRVVERYFGAQAAQNAAWNMEYRRSARPQTIDDV